MLNINKETQIHYCYLLLSNKKKKSSYIGYSIDPSRRLRQHNGEIKKGAKKTKDGTPWYFGICIGGFPDRIAALKFEWAWQNPNICRLTRDHIKSWKIIKSTNSDKKSIFCKKQWSIQQRISILVCMITIEPWKNMNLTIFVFKDIIEDKIIKLIENLDKYKLSYNFSRPNILNDDCLMFLYNGNDNNFEKGIKFLKCDYDTFNNIQKNILDYDSDINIEDNSIIFVPDELENINCLLCKNNIEKKRKYIEFPCCNNIFSHISCINLWGESFKNLENKELNNIYKLFPPLIPNIIICPSCFQSYEWNKIKDNYLKIIEDLSEDSLENNYEDFIYNENIEISNKNDFKEKDKNDLLSDEFSEISQKCEFIDLTVDTD